MGEPNDLPDATYDWRDVRHAIVAAEPDFMAKPDAYRDATWAFVERVIENLPRLRARCIGCRKQFDWLFIYRCFDCGAKLCKDCIKPHCGKERT